MAADFSLRRTPSVGYADTSPAVAGEETAPRICLAVDLTARST
jgi:hypothetical protein